MIVIVLVHDGLDLSHVHCAAELFRRLWCPWCLWCPSLEDRVELVPMTDSTPFLLTVV